MSEREELLERLFLALWNEKPRADLLIRDVLNSLVRMLSAQGCDFSRLQGHEDLAMWIAHSYDTGLDCWTDEERRSIAKAFHDAFPDVEPT